VDTPSRPDHAVAKVVPKLRTGLGGRARQAGDATYAEVVVVAVPSGQIADALGKVGGLAGKVAIDLGLVVAVTQAGLGPFFHRYAKPGEL
jgi:predicted dinucleotide-binding enzyme